VNRARVACVAGHDVTPHLRREASIHRDMGAVNLYNPCKRCNDNELIIDLPPTGLQN
jgi:hypothetical protein